MQGKRILYVVNNPAFLVSHRFELAQAAAARGMEVHVAAPDGEGIDVIKGAGFRFHRVPLERAGLNPLEDLATLGALWMTCQRVRPDLLHLVTIKPVLYGGVVGRLGGARGVVSAISGMGNLFIDTGVRKALIRAAVLQVYRFALGHPNGRTIVQNPDDQAFVLGARMVAPSRLEMIKGSGVDTARWSPCADEPEGPPVVVLASRMVVDKGVREFVEAARLLRARGVAARMVLVGAVDDKAQYPIAEAELRAWCDAGLVEWWGYQRDMLAVNRKAHVACLPSWNEGLPKGLIEAASCGLPIVATDVPGCREIARHGENALLVPARAPGLLAEALEQVVTDPALRRRLGQRGRAMVEQEFSLQMVIQRTLGIYAALLGDAAAA